MKKVLQPRGQISDPDHSVCKGCKEILMDKSMIALLIEDLP